MDRQQFLVPFAHNAGHIFVKLFFVLLLNHMRHMRTSLDGKDDLNVDL